MKLKKNTAISVLFFLGGGRGGRDVDIEKVLVCNKISFSDKNYTLLVTRIVIIKLSHYKTSAYVKSYDV